MILVTCISNSHEGINVIFPDLFQVTIKYARLRRQMEHTINPPIFQELAYFRSFSTALSVKSYDFNHSFCQFAAKGFAYKPLTTGYNHFSHHHKKIKVYRINNTPKVQQLYKFQFLLLQSFLTFAI